jgi:cytosine/creatinine deaminase
MLKKAPRLFAKSESQTSKVADFAFFASWLLLARSDLTKTRYLSVTDTLDYQSMIQVALEEARQGLAEGGIPIGAALFDTRGALLGRGHNRRVQEGDPSIHGETDAFRRAGRQRSYRDKIMVTTLAPCWYCSGLIRQFRIGTVVVGESVNFQGGIDWLRENGVNVILLDSQECVDLLAGYIDEHPEVWNEDIGEDFAVFAP